MQTSKIRSVRKTCSDFSILGDYINNALLDEVHFCTVGAFAYDVISWLINFEFEFGDNLGHEVRIGMSEEWHRGNESSAIVIDNFLLIVK